VGLIIALIAKNWDTVRSKTADAWNGVVNAVRDGITNVVEWVRGLPERMVSALGSLAGMLVSAGGDLMRGLIRGISDNVGAAVRAVKDAVGSVIDGAKAVLGIHSPSRVFRAIGQDTTEGMRLGIADGADSIRRELMGAMADLPTAVSVNTNLEPRGLHGADGAGVQINLNGPISARDDQTLADRLMRNARDAVAAHGIGAFGGVV